MTVLLAIIQWSLDLAWSNYKLGIMLPCSSREIVLFSISEVTKCTITTSCPNLFRSFIGGSTVHIIHLYTTTMSQQRLNKSCDAIYIGPEMLV